jgi:DNA-binding NarL/FixJ family response regulator
MAFGSTLATEQRRAERVSSPRLCGTYRRAVLSPRLAEMRPLIAAGMSFKEIAGRMGLTLGSAKIYASELYRLTGMTRHEIIAAARSEVSQSAEGEPRMGAFE